MREFIEIPSGRVFENEFVETFFEANKPRLTCNFVGWSLDMNMNLRMTYLDTETGWTGEIWSTLMCAIGWGWKNRG